MPEDAKESKAMKLAAARKKLKEYQIKEKRTESNGFTSELQSGTTSATLSEKSNSELNLNGDVLEMDGLATPPVELPAEINTVSDIMESFEPQPTPSVPIAEEAMTTAAAYFTSIQPVAATGAAHHTSSDASDAHLTMVTPGVPTAQTQQSVNAIQLLICEKSQLNAELNKHRTWCREKDLENEELRTQLMATTRRLDELQQRYVEQQRTAEELRSSATMLHQQLAQSEEKSADQAAHLKELQQQISKAQNQCHELERLHKEKCNELEFSQIRINQLSDESCITKDTRVETLTQTQFMYEQQIRDLQAMVQQLTQDKEQANLQYQNYAQHLNAEVSNLNEKNSEVSDECTRLREREQQLVQHISDLEREIQKNITRRDQLLEVREQEPPVPSVKQAELEKEIAELREQISEHEFERHEFQLKIKSQEDRLEAYVKDLQQKQRLIEELQQHLQNISTEQPDKVKLLAAMESDKIAASRAVTQNVELKKQLDELEQRFVQLTNDKADLMNRLDAEEYANREMRASYTQMETKLRSIDERFKFKDEEMIRLSHENMDLSRKNLMLQQQVDRLKHYEVKEYQKRYAKDDKSSVDSIGKGDQHDRVMDREHHHHVDGEHHDHEHPQHNQDHEHDHQGHEHDHQGDEHDHQGHEHDHQHDHQGDEHDHQHDREGSEHHHPHGNNRVYYHGHSPDHEYLHMYKRHSGSENETTSCQEADEELHTDCTDDVSSYSQQKSPQMIPTTQAVEKLQQRFTQLMSQVADLTDEKQRLEHLVLQLQSETETIGEYIALYQTQRRMLKQREYEKAAQMKLLQAEREQMQEKITLLNNLVSSLGAELPTNARLAEHFSVALTGAPQTQQSSNLELQSSDNRQQSAIGVEPHKFNSTDSQEILTKIQSIISEIKENTKDIPTVMPTVDHLNCCLGKFEVV